jgi:hypothetical protein
MWPRRGQEGLDAPAKLAALASNEETPKLTTKTHRRHHLTDLGRDDPRVSVGLYSIAEAAQYLGLPYSTLQSWVSPGAEREPLVTSLPRKGYEASIPFIGFTEAFVLQAARRAGVPRTRIRPGVEAVKAQLGLEHALASKLLYTDGAELLVRYAAEDDDLEVARTRQRQLTKTVKRQLLLITYAGDGYAARLRFPATVRPTSSSTPPSRSATPWSRAKAHGCRTSSTASGRARAFARSLMTST